MSADRSVREGEMGQHWIAERNSDFDIHREAGWIIRYHPTPEGKKNEDGSTTYSLSFPALVMSDWVNEPERAAKDIAAELNAYPTLTATVQSQAEEIERLRGLLVEVSDEAVTFGGGDGSVTQAAIPNDLLLRIRAEAGHDKHGNALSESEKGGGA